MSRVLRVCLMVLMMSGALALEAEADPAIGSVKDWMDADLHFYRIEALSGTHAARFYGIDQKAVYRKTLEHDSHLPLIGLPEFLALPSDQQEERRAMAGSVLERVEGFRNRLGGLVMRVVTQVDVAWGRQDMDPRVLDDLIGRLQTATGLDPTNPPVWHLLAYLTSIVGDWERSILALDALDSALEAAPADAFEDIRLRAHLDRAWLMRDLGRFEEAAAALDLAETRVKRGLEITLLRGLIAAQTGQMEQAFRLAGEVDGVDVPVFQRDWEASTLAPGILDPLAWSPKPSGHLKGWILALAWLQEGDTGMAGEAFEEYKRMRHYRFGRRFWQDAGTIYEATGRGKLADKAWGLAMLYTPYFPYLIHKPYALDLSGVTGRLGNQPFTLAFDTNFLAGNRLAFGAALVSQAMQAEDRQVQLATARKAAAELEISLRSGMNTAESSLMLGYAQAVLGNPLAMLQRAEQATRMLDRPGHDQTSRAAVEKLREAALKEVRGPGLAGSDRWEVLDLAWSPGEDHAAVESRLRARLQKNPEDGEARRDLARFLLRHGDPEEGLQLADQALAGAVEEIGLEDLILLLETDRLQNNPTRASGILELLDEGAGDRWPDARLWTLVGFICQDHGVAGARKALEYALELDPGNVGLQRHLAATRN